MVLGDQKSCEEEAFPFPRLPYFELISCLYQKRKMAKNRGAPGYGSEKMEDGAHGVGVWAGWELTRVKLPSNGDAPDF